MMMQTIQMDLLEGGNGESMGDFKRAE